MGAQEQDTQGGLTGAPHGNVHRCHRDNQRPPRKRCLLYQVAQSRGPQTNRCPTHWRHVAKAESALGYQYARATTGHIQGDRRSQGAKSGVESWNGSAQPIHHSQWHTRAHIPGYSTRQPQWPSRKDIPAPNRSNSGPLRASMYDTSGHPGTSGGHTSGSHSITGTGTRVTVATGSSTGSTPGLQLRQIMAPSRLEVQHYQHIKHQGCSPTESTQRPIQPVY